MGGARRRPAFGGGNVYALSFQAGQREGCKLVPAENAGISAARAQARRGDQRGSGKPAAMPLDAQDTRLGIRRRIGVNIDQVVNRDCPKA